MNADLERVKTLQRLDSAAETARKRLADEPDREKALDARLETAQQRVSVFGGEDPTGCEHPGVRPRLRDVLRPQAALRPATT